LRYAAGVHAFARIFKKKPSMLGAVCGAIAGLVVITRIFVVHFCMLLHCACRTEIDHSRNR
jgi:ammonia channel protein AmtB